MTVDITARHFSPSSRLQELINQKVAQIQKFNENITSCRVILDKAQNVETVEIFAHVKGKEFIVRDSADLFEKALNGAMDKLVRQVKKHRDKVVGV